jgi:hypothetical protein
LHDGQAGDATRRRGEAIAWTKDESVTVSQSHSQKCGKFVFLPLSSRASYLFLYVYAANFDYLNKKTKATKDALDLLASGHSAPRASDSSFPALYLNSS